MAMQEAGLDEMTAEQNQDFADGLVDELLQQLLPVATVAADPVASQVAAHQATDPLSMAMQQAGLDEMAAEQDTKYVEGLADEYFQQSLQVVTVPAAVQEFDDDDFDINADRGNDFDDEEPEPMPYPHFSSLPQRPDFGQPSSPQSSRTLIPRGSERNIVDVDDEES